MKKAEDAVIIAVILIILSFVFSGGVILIPIVLFGLFMYLMYMMQ